jgi:L-2-hydroxyglutarate oxidase LhgO
MHTTDFLIIGAGAVGLAVAVELSKRFPGRHIVMLERHPKFGQETSSRNSEVIHAGIYYPTGSLKARLCVEGNRLLYGFCSQWNVPHERMGKLIVATTDDEISTLESLLATGMENGVADLKMVDRSYLARHEPQVNACAAIYSPSTGIVDAHQLMARLEWRALQQGVMCVYQHEVLGIQSAPRSHAVRYRGPAGQDETVVCQWLINSTGLSSDHIAGLAGIDIDRAGYRLFPCKGEYFKIPHAKSLLVSRLIYPPPFKDLRGLGIHVTKTLDGMVRLGPNAFYVDELDYTVDDDHALPFYNSVKAYLPFLTCDDLQPDMAGIRPKLQAPGTPIRDFVIRHETEHGLQGLINLIGIESPGLTSCLSIARMVGDLIAQDES